jgi:hypothetical protein
MKLRPFFGLLVAPLIPAVAAALLVGSRGPAFDYDTASVISLSCIAGGYLAGFCVGLPLLNLWRRMRWTGPIAGVTLGSVSAACLTLSHPTARLSQPGDSHLLRRQWLPFLVLV